MIIGYVSGGGDIARFIREMGILGDSVHGKQINLITASTHYAHTDISTAAPEWVRRVAALVCIERPRWWLVTDSCTTCHLLVHPPSTPGERKAALIVWSWLILT